MNREDTMDLDSSMAAVAVVSFLAAISPGPDFFVVLRNSLVYSRKNGLITACGVSAALIVHLFYTLVGIAVLIEESTFAFSCIKVVGAAYLCYVGLKGIVTSFKLNAYEVDLEARSSSKSSASSSFMQGFLTNLLNPKCALFFISLFSQFVTSQTPGLVKIAYGGINWSITFAWFLFLSFIVTEPRFYGQLVRFRALMDRVMGGALVILGMKLLFV